MFIAPNPQRFAGQVVPNGHCVAFVRAASGAPHTSLWRRGAKVRGNRSLVTPGAAIATFGGNPARYQNRTDGSSHTAILIAETIAGLRVWDQWIGRPVAERTIQFRNGRGTANNDGDAYFLISASHSIQPEPRGAIIGDTLRRNSRGPAVSDVQRRLGIPVTGVYGPVTENAVRNFQQLNGLTVTGIVGPLTWAALGEIERD